MTLTQHWMAQCIENQVSVHLSTLHKNYEGIHLQNTCTPKPSSQTVQPIDGHGIPCPKVNFVNKVISIV